MNITLENYELYRYTEDEDGNEHESCIVLTVEGYYEFEERAGRWGRHGATPGSPAYAEVGDLLETITVEGPVVNRYEEMARTATTDYLRKMYAEMAATFTPKGPVTYTIPWDGELTKSEEEAIQEKISEAAIDQAVSAAEAAAEAAYEARFDCFG